ncbi:MAG: response regulator [Bacteroidota bacterium]
MTSKKIKVGIADDHLLFRQGLCELLKKDNLLEINFETGEVRELSKILNQFNTDVLLLDISMPEINGLKLLPILRKKFTNLKIIILSQFCDNQTVLHALKNGANGFLTKTVHFTEIINAIKISHEEGYYLPSNISNLMAKNFFDENNTFNIPITPITNREKEILKLICEQKTSKEMSEELFISPRTVESHLENLYKKTGIKKKEGLVIFAIKNGIYTIS